MQIKPEFKDKAIRSFVIRSGRMTDGQRGAFERAWARYGLSLFDGPLRTEDVFPRIQPLIVEVGFGMGDSLLHMAQVTPEQNFVGIEVHPPGVGRLISRAAELDVDNLRVYMADATDVLADCIAGDSVARLQLYFPDPWHKKKHYKRRIVQPAFVELIARKLRPGGLLHMATDWQNYAQQMLDVLQDNPKLTNTTQGFAPRPTYRPKTKFEVRGEQLGHGVWDLIFRKNDPQKGG